MLHPTAYVIRAATDADADALRRLAELDSRRALTGRRLVAELDGEPVAAISMDDQRTVADPFRPSAVAVTLLRVRADALVAYERAPSLRERLLAAIRGAARRPVAGRA